MKRVRRQTIARGLTQRQRRRLRRYLKRSQIWFLYGEYMVRDVWRLVEAGLVRAYRHRSLQMLSVTPLVR